MSSKRLVIFLLLLLAGCGYDSHEGCVVQFEEVAPTLHLSRLSSYAESGNPLPEGAIIKGRVVANDASGNFYRTIVIEEEGVGVELRLALYDLHALFPVGSLVSVRCEGLRVARHDGCLCLGRAIYGWSGGSLEPIAPRSEVLRRIEVVDMGEEPSAMLCTLDELSSDMCGRLVEVEGLRYEGEPTGWAVTNYGSEVDHIFEVAEEQRIIIRTSRYADFAAEKIPEGLFGARGILYVDRVDKQEVFVIKLRDRGDVVE